MQDKKLLYPNLSAELARNNQSVRALSDYLGMTSQNLYSKLRGASSLSEKDMKAIQRFFIVKAGGVFTMDYLFSNEPISNGGN
jgi:hypothetical protein|nr:MAG TPA: C2 repressor [Caudoviricetes sp.]